MPLIIDCNNLMHTAMPAMLAGLDEEQLCKLLARSPWAPGGIIVVCDGHPRPLGLTESPAAEVELIYSGTNRTADDVIISHINAHTAPRRLIVVSSDNEIRRAARRRRCSSWTCDYFIHRLCASLQRAGKTPPTRPGKPSHIELDEHSVDAWLREFGYAPPKSNKNKPAARDDEDNSDTAEDEDDDSKYWPPW